MFGTDTHNNIDSDIHYRLDDFDTRLYRAEAALIAASETIDQLPNPSEHRAVKQSLKSISETVKTNTDCISAIRTFIEDGVNEVSASIPTSNRFDPLKDLELNSGGDEILTAAEGTNPSADDKTPHTVELDQSGKRPNHKPRDKSHTSVRSNKAQYNQPKKTNHKATRVTIIGSSLTRDLAEHVDRERDSIQARSYPHPGFSAEDIRPA